MRVFCEILHIFLTHITLECQCWCWQKLKYKILRYSRFKNQNHFVSTKKSNFLHFPKHNASFKWDWLPFPRSRPQPDLWIYNTYIHITWYADAWGHDLSPHQKLRSHDLYFMVEWFQLSLRSDISSGKTWLRIIRLGLQMRLGSLSATHPN